MGALPQLRPIPALLPNGAGTRPDHPNAEADWHFDCLGRALAFDGIEARELVFANPAWIDSLPINSALLSGQSKARILMTRV